MLYVQIEHLSSMKVRLTRQNFGIFLQFMRGWIMTLVMSKVNDSELHKFTVKLKSF